MGEACFDVLGGASLRDLRACCAAPDYADFVAALGGTLDRYFGPRGPHGAWSAGVADPTAAVLIAPPAPS